MSLLKLLFDLPEAGGESNFTVEEQEELMAFEHNLEHVLGEDFSLPHVDGQLGFLQGTEGASSSAPVAVNLVNGAIASGVGYGLAFGSSTIENPTLNVFSGNQEPASRVEDEESERTTLEEPATAPDITISEPALVAAPERMPSLEPTLVVAPESTPSLEPALVAAPVSTPSLEPTLVAPPASTPSLEPGGGSIQVEVATKKYDVSSKHQGSGKAVWVKWRGKWQGAIQVRVEDCRAATMKSMPTYGKKDCVPIYVVQRRSYTWIDAQNISDINEKPEPLLSGTHEDWFPRVIDTGAPRRRTFLSLGWEMLDISDRLHIMGVIERARDVCVWKEFAKEASDAAKYSELGTLLVRIHAVVEPAYVRQSWVEKRLNAWTQECLNAETAVTIEKLTKECIRVILWDEAARLWEAPEQPVLDPSWADWKGPAFDELTEPESDILTPSDKPSRPSSSSSVTPKAEKVGNSGSKRGRKPKEGSGRPQSQVPTGRVITRKQLKAEKLNDVGPSTTEHCPAASEPVAHCSQTLAYSVDAAKSEFAVDHTLETEAVASELQLKGQGSGVKLSRDGPLNSASKTWKWKFKSDAWGCSAFLKTKKRRCPRQACRGIYCEKHQGLAENLSDDPNVEPSNLCMARYWVENRRCANSVVEGSYFCVMHADCRPPKSEDSGVLNDTTDHLTEGNDKVMMAKDLRCTGVTVQDAQFKEKMKDDPKCLIKHPEQNPDQVGGRTLATSVNDGGAEVKIEQVDFQVSGRQSEKHVKGEASNANGGTKTSGPLRHLIRDKNLGRLVADMSVKERRTFLKAHDLLCNYMNQGLSTNKGGSMEAQFSKMVDSIVNESVKDLTLRDMLLKILTAEKERLANLVLEEGSTSRKSSGFQSGGAMKSDMEALSNDNSAGKSSLSPVQTDTQETGRDARNVCCLCGENYEQLSLLGRHWKEHHTQEALLFEKCLLCRICDKDGAMFRRKVDVLQHWRTTHPTLPTSSPSWSVCVMCEKQFSDFDHLWQHVEDQHHGQWSSADFARRVEAILTAGNSHKCSFCIEMFSTSWEVQQHKENVHRDQELVHSGTKRNWNAMDGVLTGNDSKRADVDTYKYSCRYCRMKFQLLPDLGRHHQAVHKVQGEGRAKDQSPSGGMLSMQKSNTKQEVMGGDSDGVKEGADQEGNVKKWRYRARAKSKNVTRGRSVPLKKQAGGAEAILQRMRAVKQVLVDQKTTRPPRKRDRKAERARRLARLAGNTGATPAPITTKSKCRFCGLEFAALPELSKHHQAEHSAVKQAFIVNGRGECQTGIYTLTKDGIIGPVHGELLNRPPNSQELLEVARCTCCKDWFFNELGKRFAILPPRLFVQAAHLCSEAKIEIRWHQDNYLCPDGCKTYDASPSFSSLPVDLSAFAKTPNTCADEVKKDVIRQAVLLSEDLSNGLEKVPIRCVMDGDVLEPCSCSLCTDVGSSTSPRDSQPWNTFVYITKRLLDPSLGLDTKSSQVGCSCTGEKCSASTCDHVAMFDNDNAGACSIDGSSIRGRFPYDEFGRIILDVGYMGYECNSSCQCNDSCQNRILQKGVHLKLEVFKSRHKGWGVRAGEAIARGTFVCEYVGEVLNDSEANRRGERYDQVGCSYLYNIDAHLDVIGSRSVSKPFVIDATRYGNVARFINHSCDPNLINYEVLVESMDCQLAHIGFFAKRDIAVGEELAYDYRYTLLPGKGCPCHCGALNCRGRLY